MNIRDTDVSVHIAYTGTLLAPLCDNVYRPHKCYLVAIIIIKIIISQNMFIPVPWFEESMQTLMTDNRGGSEVKKLITEPALTLTN